MNNINFEKVLAQFESIRRYGFCNMFDKRCVECIAEILEYYELIEYIRNYSYYELIEQFDSKKAEEAFFKYIDDLV